jgi:hypothetical protein
VTPTAVLPSAVNIDRAKEQLPTAVLLGPGPAIVPLIAQKPTAVLFGEFVVLKLQKPTAVLKFALKEESRERFPTATL